MRLIVLLFATILTACGESDYDDRVRRLEKAVEEPISSGGDYWIYKRGDFYSDQQYKVGLIFGYGDNKLVCDEMIEVYRKTYSKEHLSCVPAN
ncbi:MULTISPECIES: hypothetical protein [Thalassospira]|jgi:hypothetical protein|uniref:hypothetical protein n=1 Tax=Thalassospira TaxID=168934 RepID=UPI00080FDF71|nr:MULTISPECIES: hypothetical protein [Thalassospira]OCK06290.1 hypothetical protein KO164_0467 [Thalassospira sp. KO164]SED63077.1 hypothetical protein SAMN04515623_0466 [Thalassospira permensis]MAB35308.1 hypothetical protein [Thalassospira sp.]MBA06037.1 hypothetical protein [Thalassospira sp.]MDM7974702.1 hypothetical protein [Thalassospira xiamenensis]|tara:strand:- start:5593 stop:5871 length:279 start_codon:yes stop_codon:yes gene_type:complete